MMSTRCIQESCSGQPAAARRRAMRIGLYTPTYPGIAEGGIGTYTRNLAQGLCAQGHAVHVLTPAPRSDCFADGAVTVHTTQPTYLRIAERVVPGIGSNLRVGNAMRRLVAEHDLDLVEFPNWEGFGIYFCMRRTVPVVVRLYTSSLDSQAIDGGRMDRQKRWDIRREKWQAKLADALVTHSNAHRMAIARDSEAPPDSISIVPLGIPVFPDFERRRIERDHFSIVYLGRLERRKGTIDLLRAIPEILKHAPNVRFRLIGADRPHCPGERSHAQFVAEEFPKEVQQHVELLGELPAAEVDRWLQTADLFVAPSLYESFGLIFVEAMRWGTPVVGTRAGGIPEIVEDGVTGALAEPGDWPGLAAKIVELLRDERRRRRLGEAGRRHVELHFSVQRMADCVARLYEETLAMQGRRRQR